MAVTHAAPNRIRAVLFDLDDTLFDHRGAASAAIAARTAALGGDPVGAGARWLELEEHHYHRYLGGELAFAEQRAERVRDYGALHGWSVPDPGGWWDEYHALYVAAWRLHPDAVRCLERLADRTLGIITNGDLAAQRIKAAAVGLDALPLITSGGLGIAKPDARIFREACRRLGVAPGEAAYVGDRLRTDALGAAGAGLLGVWLDRAGVASPADRAAASAASVPIIRTLDDLPALLG